MVNSNYVPEKGDLVWLDFDPQAGHEQKGRRPAICVFHKHIIKKLDLLCSVDWKQRNCDFIEKATDEEIDSVVDNIKLLIE